jgi:hypothetical protein
MPLAGAKLTVTVQVPFTGIAVAQLLDTKLNPAPATLAAVGAVTSSGPTPVFDRVAVMLVVEPAVRLPKAIALKLADWTTPVPATASDAGADGSLAVTARAPE